MVCVCARGLWAWRVHSDGGARLRNVGARTRWRELASGMETSVADYNEACLQQEEDKT